MEIGDFMDVLGGEWSRIDGEKQRRMIVGEILTKAERTAV